MSKGGSEDKMNDYTRHYCGACGQEQQQVGEIRDYIYCEKCGAKIFGDGSCEYDGSQSGIEEREYRIDKYDDENEDR